MMVLDLGTWVQFHTLEATYYLDQSFATMGLLTDRNPKGDTSPPTISTIKQYANMVDCWVIDTTLDETVEVVYFPPTKKIKRASRRESIIDRAVVDESIDDEIEVILYLPQSISTLRQRWTSSKTKCHSSSKWRQERCIKSWASEARSTSMISRSLRI